MIISIYSPWGAQPLNIDRPRTTSADPSNVIPIHSLLSSGRKREPGKDAKSWVIARKHGQKQEGARCQT